MKRKSSFEKPMLSASCTVLINISGLDAHVLRRPRSTFMLGSTYGLRP